MCHKADVREPDNIADLDMKVVWGSA